MSRRKARVLAFQALYWFDFAPVPPEGLLDFGWEAEKIGKIAQNDLAFARHLTAGTVENIDVIDTHIKRCLINWDFARLKRVDVAILRISVFSLLFQREIPHNITIEEAIAISKEYGTDNSYKFINGILENIRKTAS